jgi:hypothetical protein
MKSFGLLMFTTVLLAVFAFPTPAAKAQDIVKVAPQRVRCSRIMNGCSRERMRLACKRAVTAALPDTPQYRKRVYVYAGW